MPKESNVHCYSSNFTFFGVQFVITNAVISHWKATSAHVRITIKKRSNTNILQ